MSYTLLSGALAQVVGTPRTVPVARQGIVFQAILKGTASQSVSATVRLYGSNDPLVCGGDTTNCCKETLATYSLSGTAASGGLADSGVWLVTAPYSRFWGEVTAIAGTGAAVYLIAST
jgi:hypothetical protein